LVHIKDEGSQFDAPIDVVWKFIQTPDAHGRAHATTRNQQMKPLSETSMLISMEQNMNGQWVKVANRITVAPPLGLLIEVVEGPMAGSKMVNIYTAKGNKTGIDVYGEFTSSQIPAHMLEPAVRANLQTVFDEDSKAIKTFSQKR
jgi:hypothetical protein